MEQISDQNLFNSNVCDYKHLCTLIYLGSAQFESLLDTNYPDSDFCLGWDPT
jgi:hypothetical protein